MARIIVDSGQLVVYSSFAEKDLCREIPGRRWDPISRTWRAQLNAGTAKAVIQLFPGATIDPQVVEIAKRAQEEVARGLEAKAGPPPLVPEAVTRPWAHQARAWGVAIARSGTLLDMGMGTGKTKVAIDVSNTMLARKPDLKVLVLAPTNVTGVWPRQWRQHGSPAWEGRVVLVDDVGSIKRRTEVISQVRTMTRPVVMVLGHGSCSYGGETGKQLRDAIVAQPWDLVVLDEAHRAKTTSGNLSKLCGLLSKVPKRLALTGTPMPKDPLDVYGIARFVSPHTYEPTFFAFRKHYAILSQIRGAPSGAMKVSGYRDLDRLRELMGEFTFSARTQDVLELPPTMHERLPVTLGSGERSAYDALEGNAAIKIRDNVITAANAAVEIMRLQQITGGSVTDEVGNHVRVGSAKKDRLIELLEDIGPDEPVAVFCRFRAELEQIKEAFREARGEEPLEVSGNQNDLPSGLWERGNSIVLQVQAGSVGIDLTRGRYAVLWSLNYSLGDYEQLLARIHRPGQTRPCTYYHLVATGTADELIYKALSEKKSVVELVLSSLRESDSKIHQTSGHLTA